MPVSFPERYCIQKGWGYDILGMRSPGVWGDLCKCVALRALIHSLSELYSLVMLPFDSALGEGGTPSYRRYRYVQPQRV